MSKKEELCILNEVGCYAVHDAVPSELTERYTAIPVKKDGSEVDADRDEE